MTPAMVLDISADSSSQWLLPYTDRHGQAHYFVVVQVDDFDLQVYGPFNTVSKAETFHASARNVLGHTLADLQALVDDDDDDHDANLN